MEMDFADLEIPGFLDRRNDTPEQAQQRREVWNTYRARTDIATWVDPVDARQRELKAMQDAAAERDSAAKLPERVAALAKSIAALDPKRLDYDKKLKNLTSLHKSLSKKLEAL